MEDASCESRRPSRCPAGDGTIECAKWGCETARRAKNRTDYAGGEIERQAFKSINIHRQSNVG
jgi:hypothetical protein